MGRIFVTRIASALDSGESGFLKDFSGIANAAFAIAEIDSNFNRDSGASFRSANERCA
jgi:hypothetical protein